MKKTNFDRYLGRQLEDKDFAARFHEAGEAWNVAGGLHGPNVYLIGGPNGAGKTTVAMRLLPDFIRCREYVNADAIAGGLSSFAPESVALQAGRLMLSRVRELAEARADFAFETTLASRTFAPLLRRWQSQGYSVTVIYLWLRSPDLAVERVTQRVHAGGHGLPPDVIRRRYEAGRRNFTTLYQPLADRWKVYDNSGLEPALVGFGGRGQEAKILLPGLWRDIVKTEISP